MKSEFALVKGLNHAKNKIAGAVFGAYVAVSCAACRVYCDSDIGGIPVKEIPVDTNVDAKKLIGRIIGILCAAIAIGGMVSLINGYSDYTTAKKDENATAMTKAANKITISIVEIATPVVVAFLFK